MDPNALKLYPNSNLNGQAMPLDILLSKGLIMQPFTATPANEIDLPTDTDILVIYGDDTHACFVQLDGDAAVPDSGEFVAGLHYIPENSVKVIDVNGASTFSVVSLTGNAGTLIIECAYAYKDARRAKQHSNI